MASIHRRPRSPYWHASYQLPDGTRTLRSTKCTDRIKALAAALEFERASKMAGEGNLVEAQARKILVDIMERVGSGKTLRSPTIKFFFTDWLKSIELNNSRGTHERYSVAVNALIKSVEPRANNLLTSLTVGDVEKFKDARKETGLAPKTLDVDIKIIRSALNHAKRIGLIPTNPADAVKVKKVTSVERGTYNSAEVKMLVDAANGEWKTLIMSGYYLGARLGDCCRLEWEKTDFKILTYHCSKTNEDVTVPLHPDLATHLRAIATSDKAEKFIMPKMANLKSGGRHGLSESFKAIARRAGLDLQTVQGGGVRKLSRRTFHALRHSFTSALANQGVAAELRMKLTGHKTEDIHRGYTHHEFETLRSAVEKIPSMRAGDHKNPI